LENNLTPKKGGILLKEKKKRNPRRKKSPCKWWTKLTWRSIPRRRISTQKKK